MANILRSVVGRLLGLDAQDNLVLAGSKIYYGHSTNQDAVVDLTTLSGSTNPFGARTPAEQAATVTPVNLLYPENDIRRYANSFGSNDNAAWDACRAVATQNGRPMFLAGLNLKFTSGITWDYYAHGIDGEGARLDFSGLSGTQVALTVDTTNTSYTGAYAQGGFRRFSLVGPGSGSTVDGVKFGTTGNPHFGAFALIDQFYITQFRYDLTWGSSSWLQVIGNGFLGSALWGIYYPSGLSISGENIGFGHITIGNCTNGIFCRAGTLNFEHLSIDYQTNVMIQTAGQGVVRASHYHLESNNDNSVWLSCADAGSHIDLIEGEIYNAGTKTAFPVGSCTNTGAAQINFGKLALQNFTEANYGFGYLVDGHGTIEALSTANQVNSGGTTACVPFNGNNLLLDGGFEKTTIYDWLSVGNGAQGAISSAQHWAGSQSLSQAPAAGQTCIEIAFVDVNPGDWVQFGCRLLFAGTASTDHAFITLQFYDENGASIATNSITRDISSLPSSWTRYTAMPFGQAPPGTRHVQVQISKAASGGGNSDGNGAIYWDDCYLSVVGKGGRLPSPQSYPPTALTAQGGAFQFRAAKGLAIDGIRILNTTANAITGGLKIGSSSGGTDVASAIAVGANAEVYVPGSSLAKQYLTSTGRQNYFVDAVTGWNSASINITVFLKRILTQGY